jgi:DNA-binding Lrp family transcriptional regulator
MTTKSQDVVVALKLSLHGLTTSYASLAKSIGMSVSETHAAVRRLAEARLFDPVRQTIDSAALRLFLVHGVPHAFPAHPQHIIRGMPTAWAAPLNIHLPAPAGAQPPVWPDPEGTTEGAFVEPLYPSVPRAARFDGALYELLALIDVLRLGRFQEKTRVAREIALRLGDSPQDLPDIPPASDSMPAHLL